MSPLAISFRSRTNHLHVDPRAPFDRAVHAHATHFRVRSGLLSGWFAVALLPALLSLSCRERTDTGTIHLNGRLEAPLVDLAPRVAGRVVEVRVREGDRVKAGDLLLRLDLGETALAVPRDRAGLESAEAKLQDLAAGSRSAEIGAARADVQDKRAALSLAAKERDRQKSLLEQQITTHQEFDKAAADFERAQAALQASEQRLELTLEGFRKWQKEQARADVERARGVLRQSEVVASEAEIHAPADAIVLHRMAEPGLLVAPGQPALTLAFADRLYVRTFIPETDLGKVRPGQRATVAVDAYPGKEFPARVTEISPNAEFTPKQVETKRERVDLVYAAKVDLDGAWSVPLLPGQPAEVTIVAADPGGAHAR